MVPREIDAQAATSLIPKPNVPMQGCLDNTKGSTAKTAAHSAALDVAALGRDKGKASTQLADMKLVTAHTCPRCA